MFYTTILKVNIKRFGANGVRGINKDAKISPQKICKKTTNGCDNPKCNKKERVIRENP